MKFVDYYKIMGVDDNADQNEIKKAYRRLAKKYHPDVSKEPDAETRFKEIGEAYNVLKNPEKRKEYNSLKKYGGAPGQDYQPPPGWEPQSGFDPSDFAGIDNEAYSDFFEQIFGNRSHRRTSQHAEEGFSARGQDMHTKLSISLDNAFHGANVPINFSVPVQHTDGRIATEPKSLNVKIPKGVRNGQKIRLRGQGGPAMGKAPPGDLYIELHIEDDHYFHLTGSDIITIVPISPWEAALGASIEVPTKAGMVKITIPEDSKSGQKLRLKGRGMPGTTPGDQYVTLSIVTPKAESKEQKDFYEKMSSLWEFDPRKEPQG